MVPPLARQIFATVGSSCTTLSNGFSVGVMSVMLPALRAPDSPIKLTMEEESWLPAVLIIMAFPAQFICGILTRRFGRKIFVILPLIPMLVTYILFYFATNYEMLFVASICAGLVTGGMAICHMMLAEMLSPKYRGVILNFKTMLSSVGVALGHFLGNYCHWRTLALFGMLVPIVGIVVQAVIPESPVWLASQGRFKESRAAFIWLRGHNEEDELIKLIEKQKRVIANNEVEKQKRKTLWVRYRTFISDIGFLKAVTLSITAVVLVEACGKHVFVLFAIDYITKIVGTKENPFFYAMMLDAADMMSIVCSCFTLHKFKRRRLLFATGIPANILLYTFCLYVYLGSLSVIPEEWSWFALVILSLYTFLEGAGVIPVAFILIGEIIPLSHRGEGVAINSFVLVGLMFLVAKLAPSLSTCLGIHGLLFIHAIITSACLVFLYFKLPETGQKTLQNIEDEINGHEEEMQSFIVKDLNNDIKPRAGQNVDSSCIIGPE